MSFFDDDLFEDIMKEFFDQKSSGKSSSGNFVRGEKEEREIDYIEEDDFVYLVFELPGYSKEDINIEINGREIEISSVKKKVGNMKDYLADKFKKGVLFKRTLPPKIKLKTYEKTFNNGVLEIKFKIK